MMNSGIRKHRMIYIALVCMILGVFPSTAQILVSEGFPQVTPLKWSLDGSAVAMVNGNDVEIISATNGSTLYVLQGHTHKVTDIDWSINGDLIATSSLDHTVKVWSADTGTLLYTLTGHDAAVTSLIWYNDDEHLLSARIDPSPTLFLWDLPTRTVVGTFNAGVVNDAIFTNDQSHLYINHMASLTTHDGATLTQLSISPFTTCCYNGMFSLALSPDEASLATGTAGGRILIWDPNTLQIRKEFSANPFYDEQRLDNQDLALSWVRAITFGMDSTTLFAVSGDGTLKQWDVMTGEVLFETNIPPLINAAWSADGSQLAYRDMQGNLEVIDNPALPNPVTINQGFEQSDPTSNQSIEFTLNLINRLLGWMVVMSCSPAAA